MSLPLVIVGALVIVAGVALLAGHRRGAASAALGLGILLVLGAFVFPTVSEEVEGLPRVHFAAPTDGAIVPAGDTEVRVAIENGELASSPTDTGGHLHLYVDDEVVQMPYASTATIDLAAGGHELRVEYVDERHVSYTPPIQDVVNVTAE